MNLEEILTKMILESHFILVMQWPERLNNFLFV